MQVKNVEVFQYKLTFFIMLHNFCDELQISFLYQGLKGIIFVKESTCVYRGIKFTINYCP